MIVEAVARDGAHRFSKLDRYQRGLANTVLDRDADGGLVRLAGVMAVVLTGGLVGPGDPIGVTLPATPHRALQPV